MRSPWPLPDVGTAPVLTVLVCHDGSRWLPAALDALGALNRRPRYVLAVDTGSTDSTPELLDAALDGGLLDGVLTMPASTGFGDAVRYAVQRAEQRWGDPGQWVWLLHDDSAPEPACLDVLLGAAEASPSVAVLGPLCLDWSDPRLVVEAGLSTDASGHRQTGLGHDELDPSLLGGELAQTTEVLAVGSAGALIRRDVWNALDGYDRALPMARDDLDFGWRVNRNDHIVLMVPSARIRHAAAGSSGERPAAALRGVPWRAADRAHGVRTFLVNASTASFAVGLPRLVLLCLLRAVGFVVARRVGGARAELSTVGYLVAGRGGLRASRQARRAGGGTSGGSVRGLLTSRWDRLRSAVRGGLLALVRRRVAADAAIGRLPDSTRWVPPGSVTATDSAGPAGYTTATGQAGPTGQAGTAVRAFGPRALPAGAIRGRRGGRGVAASVAGLRRPGISVVVTEPGQPGRPVAPDRLRPSPTPRGQPAPQTEFIVVDVGGARLVRELLLAPAVLLVVGLVLVAAALHRGRYGLDLSGGRVLPLGGVAETWAAYLAEWHPVLGGTAAPAPATLAVFGVLGALLRPFGGGPPAAASLLLLGSVPLAGLSAYVATRRLRVPRWGRAAGAAGYALLPVGIAAAVQGRLDGVVAHVLLPIVLAGVAGVLSGWSTGGRPDRASPALPAPSGTASGWRGWLPSACATALGLAVISAFAPLAHVLVLAIVLVGFVAVPGQRGEGLRRIVALFVIVLLPLGLLLPWPAVALQHPEVLLHGVGAVVDEPAPDSRRLFVLDAGGPGPAWWLGALVLAGCLLVVAGRPRRAAVPGLAVAAAGFAAAVVVSTLVTTPLPGGVARPGWPGPPLLLAACGLLWAALAALSTPLPPRPAQARPAQAGPGPPGRWLAQRWLRLGVLAIAGAAVAVMAAATAMAGAAGPLVAGRPRLAAPVAAEVAADRTGVLVVGGQDDPVRAAVGRLPGFGDDDLAPVATAPTRMARWAGAFRAGRQPAAQSAVLEAAVSGFEFVVLPDRATADALLTAAGPLVVGAPDTSDGRPTVRLLPLPMSAVVLAAPVADRARTGGAPPVDYGTDGVLGVPAAPPAVAVAISAGGAGRAMVVAAEVEDGWLATVDGQRVQVARAWGHLVAVPLPADAAEVRLERSSTVRALLLLVQLAVALFTAITAIPAGDRRA